jgi:transposase
MVLYLLNSAFFNAFFVYRALNTNRNVKYKNLMRDSNVQQNMHLLITVQRAVIS